MFRKLCLLLFILFFLIFSVKKSDAARSLSITSNKSALFGTEEMTITASPSGFTTGETIYIKGAFYQDGTTNYFGYTKNGDNWVKNGDSTTTQKQIKIGEWDGVATVKLDFGDSGYKGEGGYKFKLGFYYLTSSSNPSSVNWSSNILDISVSEPDPTPTSTPVPTNVPSLTPTKVPTATPTPSKTPTTAPLRTPTPTIAKTLIQSPTAKNENSTLFVEGDKNTMLPTPTGQDAQVLGAATSNMSWLFIALALIIFVACGILAYFQFGDKVLLWKKKQS